MSIVRDLGFTVRSLEDRGFITCSTGQIAGSGGFFSTMASTANLVASTDGAVGISGAIIDRLGDLLGHTRFTVAMPTTFFHSTRGSTGADRKISLGVKLQHGDSSGGGDLADFSTGSQPTDKVYFSTARTTDMANWDTTGSSGGARLSSPSAYYDIRAAKRFIRAVHLVYKANATTESTGDEGGRISGSITFLGGDLLPMVAGATNYSATSSTT